MDNEQRKVEDLNKEHSKLIGAVVRLTREVKFSEENNPFKGCVGVIKEVTFLSPTDSVPYLVKWFDTRLRNYWVGMEEIEVLHEEG